MASMRQYIAWAERRMGQLVVAEGLHVRLLEVTQGPLTLTFRLRLLQPSPAALRKLTSLGAALSQALQVSGVRITEQPGHVAIEIPSPQKRTPTAVELCRTTRGLNVTVGYDARRQPVHVDLRQHGALFWIGPSRRGKTQSMKSTLYALAKRNERLCYAILCHERKRDDWRAFEGSFGCLGIATSPAEQERVLTWVVDDLMARESGRIVVLAIDDLLNLLSQADLAGPLAEIASMGAGLGVHLLAGTQEAGSRRGTGGAGVENNATARILFRNSSAAAAARATGQGAEGLQQLSGAKGDALLLLDGEPVRIATGLADDRDILQLAQDAEWVRPWLRATDSQPPATGHNQEQPAQPLVASPADNGHVVDAAEGAPQPIQTVVEVAAELFPITKRELTKEEACVIVALHNNGESLNSLCRLVYGHKDGKAYEWVKKALEGAQEGSQGADKGAQKRQDAENANKVDMNGAEGLATPEALRSASLSPRETSTEEIKSQ